ncbi:MAG: dicarboxylate/amino acid:cation symporter [Gammaproteobacteria bacterium TMED30]|jgi:Na+/H+-dicarboxylate symporter|nr:dicarboxylate/amino acid:cation symporter [Gammaproteobacteria bacterium]OUU01750.1 MAG: dicarboxylate/amino acid:cation symporter [Gammaproteobacteria bacterium TMED30]
MSLTKKILIGMTLGLALGVLFQVTDLVSNAFIDSYVLNGAIDAGGKIFVTLLKMMVVPLVFVSLVCGARSLGATGSVGRLGGKTIGLYLLTTALAVSFALMLALIVDPGLSASDDNSAALTFDAYQAKEAPSVKDTLINIFPANPIQAMAEGSMLQVIVFALLLGLALSRAGAAGDRIADFFADLNQVMMKLITMVIQLTPYGVFCLMVKLGATVGWVEIGKVLAYFLTVASALILHGLIVYPSLLKVLTGINPLMFLRKMREPMLVAFSTSSSGATLPVTLRTVEHRIGVNNNVAAFAVPLGATINMDGTAIMQGVATVFIAQFFGYQLGVDALLMVVLTATLASIGTAAVPGVGLITLTLVLDQVGLPVEGIGLIIGVDRLLDMLRTVVNVTGDGTVATIVAKTEGQLDLETLQNPTAGAVAET